ncbi:Glycosyltransferase involved in cell wall bisynthesis [Candidatus Methanophagaceae archaeon]|nr:Glycosyltransferase involved in cell wall bisynthesis [Methanophagales archaeon]
MISLGWSVSLVAAGIPNDEVDPRIDIIYVPKPNIFFVGYLIFHLILVAKLIVQADYDIIFFHQISAIPLLVVMKVKRLLTNSSKPKMVMDTRTLSMSKDVKGKLREFYFRAALFAAKRWADGQTAISQRIVDSVSIPSTQLLGIWPSGVNLDLFSDSSREWPAPDESIRLIYIGSLGKIRNLTSMCEAILLARESGINVEFEMIGEGSQRKELENQYPPTDGQVIHVREAIPQPDVPEALKFAHVGCTPIALENITAI